MSLRVRTAFRCVCYGGDELPICMNCKLERCEGRKSRQGAGAWNYKLLPGRDIAPEIKST